MNKRTQERKSQRSLENAIRKARNNQKNCQFCHNEFSKAINGLLTDRGIILFCSKDCENKFKEQMKEKYGNENN